MLDCLAYSTEIEMDNEPQIEYNICFIYSLRTYLYVLWF